MQPAGYLYKIVAERPEDLKGDHIQQIYSVSSCISKNFADYIPYWKHNGYWLFDTPDLMVPVATSEGISLDQSPPHMKLFYYEIDTQEWNEETHQWIPFTPEPAFPTAVQIPVDRRLEGYDVVSYSGGSAPECSPLSCNSLANRLLVNQHCLFETFGSAARALESGQIINAEPGPYRIVGVYSVNASAIRAPHASWSSK